MKKLLSTVILLFIIVINCGCHRSVKRIFPFGWERIDPSFDSLTEVLEWEFINGTPLETIAANVDAMHTLASIDSGNRQKQVRAMYWDARYRMRDNRYDEAMDLFSRTERLARRDSSRYPYDLARIRWNAEPAYDALTVDTYDKILSDISFFESQEDYSLAAAKCMDLGMLFSDLGSMEESMTWLHRADSLFSIAGLQDAMMKNSGNMAKNLYSMGEKEEAEKILRSIVANPRIDLDPAARDIFLYNLYIYYSDTTALRRAYDWVKTMDHLSDIQCLYESCFAYEYAKGGQMDSALVYMARAEKKFTDFADPWFQKMYYCSRAEVLKAAGESESAYVNMQKYAALTDTVNNNIISEQVLNADIMRQLGEHRLQLESARHRSTVIFIVIIMSLVMAGGVVSFLFYRKWRRRREAIMRSELELERSRRKVVAMQLAMEESGRIVESMGVEVEKLASEGNMPPTVAQQLGSTIRAHESVRTEQRSFIDTFGEIDPDFIPKLRERWPELTDTDIRLCVYLSLGLDSKHIARQMGIRPESVKQARWRLRKKLDPTGSSTIEDILKTV